METYTAFKKPHHSYLRETISTNIVMNSFHSNVYLKDICQIILEKSIPMKPLCKSIFFNFHGIVCTLVVIDFILERNNINVPL